MEKVKVHTELISDTVEGLAAFPKFLLSKYFYDDRGSKIFQDIMRMPEYYLTDCEHEIFSLYKDEIANVFQNGGVPFDLVELGAGDGSKTKTLLRHMLGRSVKFSYRPIDISQVANIELATSLKKELPSLKVDPLTGDFFQLLGQMNGHSSIRKIVLFLGSNIGNFSDKELHLFLSHLKNFAQKGDMLFIGFDLKKSPEIIMKAYDDPHGHTRDFNLNLLNRLNRELEANFQVENFEQYTEYNPQTGEVKSFLISRKEQSVFIGAADRSFEFRKWEPIFTELSRKFDLKMIKQMAESYGFEIKQQFTDHKKYFIDSLWIKKD